MSKQTWQQSWAYNKYWAMAHSQAAYNQIRQLAKNNQWSEDKEHTYQQILKKAEQTEPTKATLTTAYQHVWGYFKKISNEDEKQKYMSALKSLSPHHDQLGKLLVNLTDKYQVKYLQQSRIIQVLRSDPHAFMASKPHS